jgi:mono/diheme cytochrome c family protein
MSFLSASLVCVALFSAAPSTSPAAEKSNTAPTFNKHVAPILWQNCASCHRPGEVGPFSLLSYDDAAKRAKFLVEITAERRMPPWKAEPNFGHFSDERRLSDADLKTLRDWAAAGAPEGDAKDLPTPPKFVDGWQLGTPDLILEMPEAFNIPADGRDIYSDDREPHRRGG